MAKQERGLRFQPTGGTKAPQVPAGKKQRLSIERLANDGRGIAFIEGRTWFVSGALAGEEVEAGCWGHTVKWSRRALSVYSPPVPAVAWRLASWQASAEGAVFSICPTMSSLH